MDIAVIGAGNRARKYLSCLPGGVSVSCLVEPDPLRLSLAAEKYNVPESGRYSSAEDFFASAHEGLSAVIVATPDGLHVPMALQAVRRGWHILVEKPVAGSYEDYTALLEASASVHVGVCLEMRFHPYFMRIKELVSSGAIGSILEIDHTEHIGPDRMAHTFVRGLWSRVSDSGPIFLSKCCHDADFLLWLTGGSVESVSSSGRIAKFRAACAPDGARGRCLGCLVSDCPYSAVSLYKERSEWVSGFDVPSGQVLDDVIDAELVSGRYGRCVYHCDNDVFDTQDVEALLSSGIRLHMHLEGTSEKEGRTTVIRGTEGVLYADGGKITVLSDGVVVLEEDFSHLAGMPLHAGADRALVEDFFDSIRSGRSPRATLSSALEGHKLCYLAG